MLQVLRDSHNTSYIKLSQQFHCDLNWFHIFLKQYNGDMIFKCTWMPHCRDWGGVFGPLVYALPLGTEFQHLHITQLEMLVFVTLKVWSPLWANKKVKIFCDNQAVIEVLNTGKTKDPFLPTCARNVMLITAIFNIEIIVIHVPLENNHVDDLLSRWVITVNPEDKLRSP